MEKKYFSTMPKAYLKKWLTALRSGEYVQGKGTLYHVEDDQPKFCCLGVLQHCLTGGVEFEDTGIPQGFPTMEWLKDYNIKFVDEEDSDMYGEVVNIEQPHFKLSNGNYCSASDMNDNQGKSFKQIANILEKHIKGI